MTTLYVGNLPFSATEAELRGVFEQHGKVDSVKIINDRETGRPRGFAFVDMPGDAAQAVMDKMRDFQLGGRTLRISEARERAARPPRGDGSGGDRRW